MRIGVPGGLLYYSYQPFIRTFFEELGLETRYSIATNKEILDLGTKYCVDEACLPIKIFHGHVMELQKDCDCVAIPRIMNCDFGQSICPKFEGLPELVKSGTKKENYIFTKPIRMYDTRGLLKGLQMEAGDMDISKRKLKRAFDMAIENQRNTSRGICEDGYRFKVFLGGHPYNIYDNFANMNIIEKLHRLDIGVITEEWVSKSKKRENLKGLIKNPYWLFFEDNYGAATFLEKENAVDGIIYLSSFCCGTDSFTVEMIKNSTFLPILILKLDEQTGEAGFDTRLEAFQEMLAMGSNGGRRAVRRVGEETERGGRTCENNISPHGGCPYSR